MIKNKFINVIIAVLMALALLFAVIITYIPNKLTIESKSSTTAYEETINKSQVMTVNINMDEKDWDEMRESAVDEVYYPCDITINGTTYYNVGIRPKGNSTLMQIASDDTTDRYSFKIKFDKYVKNQTMDGLDKLVLNNMMSDSTYMKEYLSYDLMEYIGVAAPLYSFASISVNDENWGLYLAIEALEESYAQRNFGSDHGQLYKPESSNMGGKGEDNRGGFNMPDDIKDFMNQNPGEGDFPGNGNFPGNENLPDNGDFQGNGNGEQKQDNDESKNADSTQEESSSPDIANVPLPGDFKQDENMNRGGGFGCGMGGSSGGADLVYTDDEISSYSTIFDSSVFTTNQSDYKRIIEAIKNLNEGTNLEEYVDVEATLRYFAANTVLVNYDSYIGSLKHNYYLYENSGKITFLPWDYNLAFAGFQTNNATSAVNAPIDTPVYGTTLEERPMIGKLLEVDEYMDSYHSYLQEIVDGYFNSGRYTETISALDKLISSYVANDPTAFCTYQEYQKGVETLKTFGLLRAKSIEGQLAGTVPSTDTAQSEKSDALILADTISIADMGSQGGGGNMNQGPKEMPVMGDNQPGTEKGATDNQQLEQKQEESDAQQQSDGKAGNNQQPLDSNRNGDGQDNGRGDFKGGFPGRNFADTTSQSGNTKVFIITGASLVLLFIVLIFIKKFRRRKYAV